MSMSAYTKSIKKSQFNNILQYPRKARTVQLKKNQTASNTKDQGRNQ